MNRAKSGSLIFAVLAVLIVFNLQLVSVAVASDNASCSIYNAIYKPHPSYFLPGALPKRSNDLNFTMTAHPPAEGEKGGSHRAIFFHIDAFDGAGKKVSTLRMADSCSNGIVRCGISTYEGQFHSNDEMKELKSGLGFEPVALNHDFFRVEYYGPEAPYAFVLPNTASVIHYSKNNPSFDGEVSEFVKFYTDEKTFPNFSGYDVWVLDSCKGKTDEENK